MDEEVEGVVKRSTGDRIDLTWSLQKRMYVLDFNKDKRTFDSDTEYLTEVRLV